MIINNIARYHSSDIKQKTIAKPVTNVVSKAAPLDTYEPSDPGRQPASSEIRGDLIQSVKKRIRSGYYNSKDVLDDLSNSFAKALNQTLG